MLLTLRWRTSTFLPVLVPKVTATGCRAPPTSLQCSQVAHDTGSWRNCTSCRQTGLYQDTCSNDVRVQTTIND